MAIIDSWGGADLTDEWFKNAQAAGSAPATGAAAAPARSVLEQNLTAGQEGGDKYRDPNYSAAQWGAWEAEERAKAGSANANNTANKYNPTGTGCPPDKAFTSAPGPDGKTECAAKPGDCPDGSGLHGSKCVGNDWLNENLGGDRPSEEQMGASFARTGGGGSGGQSGGAAGAGAAGAAAGAKPAYFGQDDPLQRMLTNQMASGGGTFAGSQTGGQFQGGGVFSQGAGQITPQGPASANPATAALQALPGTSAVAAPPAPAGTGTSVLGSAARPEMGVLGTGSMSGLQTGVMGAGSISGLDTKPSTGVMGTGSISGTNASAKQPDAFGVAQGSGSFEDLINPNRKKQDARLGGSWF
jgi:hypothetical protein